MKKQDVAKQVETPGKRTTAKKTVTRQKTDPMLEAHVQYELACLQGANLKKTLKEEIGAFLAWSEEVPIQDMVSQARVLEWVQRNVVELPITDEVADTIQENVVRVYRFLQEDTTRVEDILPREVYDAAVEVITGLEDLREYITHQLVSTSVYAKLISNVLYQGIKAFVLTENVFAKNIPGASSLVRLGQRSLNAAAPKLEGNIDKQLIRFINANIQQTIADSETFLNQALEPDVIRSLGDEVWDANAESEMTDLMDYVDEDALEAIADVVQQFWTHYRATPFFSAIVREVVVGVFEKYGARDLRSVLADMGVTEAMLVREATMFATPLVAKAIETGYLEARIRRHLSGFYASYTPADQEAPSP